MIKLAQDNFEYYFTEKLWEMIPAIYRHEDGPDGNPGVLRALVEILAEQAAILRRSHDQLWEDQFIELCQDWAVPYLGDLVATRPVSALNLRGRRVDVAKTIYYRRRKGTLRVLEELISDITGWEGKTVESFRRLARARHGLDPPPALLAGPFSGTPPGGVADLRHARIAELAGGPFDEFFHTPDVRQHAGQNGRYNIPKLAFHLYRLRAFRVQGVTPFGLADGLRFTCDPSGRDIPLFAPRQRPEDWDDWHSALEWELPAPISCRLLGHAEYMLTKALAQTLVADFGVPLASADKLRLLRGFRFPTETRLREILELLNEPSLLGAAAYRHILTTSLVPNCGKAVLLPAAISVEESPDNSVEVVDLNTGNLTPWPVSDPGRRLIIDPERGRLQFFGPPPAIDHSVTYHYGFAGEVGAGGYSRPAVETRQPNSRVPTDDGEIKARRLLNDGVTQIDNSATYSPIAGKLRVTNLTLQAANLQRPYLRLKSDWILRTPDNADALLLLDGLWLGSSGDFAVILRGDYESVTVTHCSFDPGGSNDVNGNPIQPVPLFIEASVETLVIESSLMGRIATQNGGMVEKLVVTDSILDAASSSQLAVQLARSEVTLERVTVFGRMDANRLWASEALITGVVDVTDTQKGCFRFSAAPAGSRLPRSYQAHTLVDAAHIFTSRCFGQPGYGQLSQTAPVELRRGAENGSEMGVFSKLLNSIKRDSLRTKIDEYMPFGLIPIFIEET
ncbi:MAG: hypothetical protein JXA33_12540 [Anaerolineae bacterium]|nr:hypothetical protein [Anaerolineae bacterium]